MAKYQVQIRYEWHRGSKTREETLLWVINGPPCKHHVEAKLSELRRADYGARVRLLEWPQARLITNWRNMEGDFEKELEKASAAQPTIG